jgi:hypothetical protein
MSSLQWVDLARPPGLTTAGRSTFFSVASELSGKRTAQSKMRASTASKAHLDQIGDPALRAALSILVDLVAQGWDLRLYEDGDVAVRMPRGVVDPAVEKARVRYQELLKRDEQLAKDSVRRFIKRMEAPAEFNGGFVSVLNLMRDGEELAVKLGALRTEAETNPSALRAVIDPYIAVVAPGLRCPHTGLQLTDIWRYFRHTWSNQYTTTPGRTLALLVRDRAAPYHPVIGIAALASSIVQLSDRDIWIGWQSQTLIESFRSHPTLRVARWLVRRLEVTRSEIYVDDLVKDGLYSPRMWTRPTEMAIERLEKEAESRRRDHYRFVSSRDLKKTPKTPDEWRWRAESDLFRSKRCAAMAEVLRARIVLDDYLWPKPSKAGLELALADSQARQAISRIARKAKSDSVGTEIADLSVCGSIPPYSDILGGKLVSMLAVSPTAVEAYRLKYVNQPSEIASSVAGRPISRRSKLAFVGTTSLYGSGSSQYNRLSMPSLPLGGRADAAIVYRRLGISRAYGTSHFSSLTVSSLVTLAETSRMGQRVNSIFGEGVNPKLRKVRDGIDLLGWPSELLLQHGRHRIVYGVPLVKNLLDYLLGLDDRPDYLYDVSVRDDANAVSEWWFARWASRRIQSDEVLERVNGHRSRRPSSHGAKVRLPVETEPA